MNLDNFTKAYKTIITESADELDLKSYIKSIVKDVIAEGTTPKLRNRRRLSETVNFEKSHPGPRTYEAIDAVMGYTKDDIFTIPPIPKEYDLKEIERVLQSAQDTSLFEYTNFINMDADVQKKLVSSGKYEYLKPAQEFLDWLQNTNDDTKSYMS